MSCAHCDWHRYNVITLKISPLPSPLLTRMHGGLLPLVDAHIVYVYIYNTYMIKCMLWVFCQNIFVFFFVHLYASRTYIDVHVYVCTCSCTAATTPGSVLLGATL